MGTAAKQSFDPGFMPDLRKMHLGDPSDIDALGPWGMDSVGAPVPVEGHRKAAVWKGMFNLDQEAPALSVVLDRLHTPRSHARIWRVGILSVAEAKAGDSEHLAILDATTYSAPLPLTEALINLQRLLPPESHIVPQDTITLH